MDHGGDVRVQPTLIHRYYWNSGSMMEENLYAKNYGWVRWSENKKDPITGIFTVDRPVSVHNKLVKVAVPKVVFPCF